MTALTVVIAPDSFKGSATSPRVAGALAAGWSSVRPDDTIVLAPLADGGEGTLDAFEASVPGAMRMPVTVTGPDGRSVVAHWLLLPGGIGVVELANTSGITLLDPLLPFDAHTIGFGQAIAAALDHGVDSLVLAIGGSSSTDGGTGMLTALGARFLSLDGRPVPFGNRGLGAIAAVELDGLREPPPGGVTVLTDVTSPLLGPLGAAAVFAPQKGAGGADIPVLEGGLRHLAGLFPFIDAPGAGAAGGTGFGALVWGATLKPGATTVAELLGLPEMLEHANILITGEGRFDDQSLSGKVPGHLLELAAKHGVRCILVAGSIAAGVDDFELALSLTELAGSTTAAVTDPVRWLSVAGSVAASVTGPR